MPIYEYECKECHEHKEVFQKFDDPPPKCSAEHAMTRKLSSTSFVLNGGGWASDGYGG